MCGRRYLLKRRLQQVWRWFTHLKVEYRISLFIILMGILFILLLLFAVLFVEVWRMLPSADLDMSRCNCAPMETSEGKHLPGEIYKGKVNLQMDINDLTGGGPLVLPQTHKTIMNFIWWNDHLREWSGLQYDLSKPDEVDPSGGEAEFILQTIGHKENGTFIEFRAFDGETGSKTLYLERMFEWRGLLIEPDPSTYTKLLRRNRKAWTSNLCLSTRPYPYRAYIENATVLGDIHDYAVIRKMGPYAEIIQCMPFYSIIATLGLYDVDYFSLSWGGDELTVLMSVPFKYMKFRIISVPGRNDMAGEKAIVEFMNTQGYSPVLRNDEWMSPGLSDMLFAPKTDPSALLEASNNVNISYQFQNVGK